MVLARYCRVALGFCLLAGLAAAQQLSLQSVPPPKPQNKSNGQFVIRTGVTMVDVPVIVLDKKGQPMDMFSQDDFQVSDNGIPQHLSGFDNQPRPLSLAIIIDINDPDAIGQAKRSAQLISAMVVGASGEASIFVAGAEPRQLLPFTSDSDKLTDALRHLTVGPTAALGKGGVTEPLNLAMLQLRRQPNDRTRAALIIAHDSAKNGDAAQALVESSMTDAIPIFHLTPNRPKGAPDYINPVSTEQGGTGQGSQRDPMPVDEIGSKGQPAPAPGSAATINPSQTAGVIDAVRKGIGSVLEPHNLDYVYDSGGITYSASSDGEFDAKLSLIGDELRAIYHLYYQPTDLEATASLHQIGVKIDVPATASLGSMAYRRTYLGIKQ